MLVAMRAELSQSLSWSPSIAILFFFFFSKHSDPACLSRDHTLLSDLSCLFGGRVVLWQSFSPFPVVTAADRNIKYERKILLKCPSNRLHNYTAE